MAIWLEYLKITSSKNSDVSISRPVVNRIELNKISIDGVTLTKYNFLDNQNMMAENIKLFVWLLER